MSDDPSARPPLQPDQQLRIADETLWRKLDGEAVLMQLASGTYYGVNDVGAEALAVLRDGASLNTLVASLLDRFEVDEATLRSDLNALLADMLKRGLIEVAPTPA